MINQDITIDFVKKVIKLRQKKLPMKELYTYLQDVFDEPENMKYAIPMEAISPTKFKLINGWKLI